MLEHRTAWHDDAPGSSPAPPAARWPSATLEGRLLGLRPVASVRRRTAKNPESFAWRRRPNPFGPLESALAVLAVAVAGCTTSSSNLGWKPNQDAEYSAKVSEAVEEFMNADPGMKRFFDQSYGYAVFPSIGKGGAGVGGAYGTGQVFEQGRLVGRASVVQVTVGFQLGAQVFREIIFFRDEAALADFRQGNFELDAQVSAVAATKGASANVSYSSGVAIFTIARGGLMYEASVGGQKFEFEPISE